jgi:glutamate synthase (ferredoxin)
VSKKYDIVNVDRSALGRVAGEIARVGADRDFPGTVKLDIRGSAGQSFGCFLVGGMDVTLVGEANDYVGKGMAGGVLTIKHPESVKYKAEDAALVGNTCLYGATGGKMFVNGRAGERFAVRNSMCQTVVEGAGDHCCEYMTGGTVVCLGTVGRNVAAGMTGGLGYFYDEEGNFMSRVNQEIVAVQRLQTAAGEKQLKDLIQEHVDRTGSPKGQALLANWNEAKGKFWQLVPPSEASTPYAQDAAKSAATAAA